MPIVNIYPNDTGHSADVPGVQRLETNDTVAVVTATGYLNHAVQSGFISISETDIVLVATSSVQGKPANQTGWYEVSYEAGNWSLVQASLVPSDVVLLNPSADQTITSHNLIVDAGNIQAGSVAGTAGQFLSYPGTASTGYFTFKGVANAGNYSVTFSNSSFGQATTISIPDPSAASANVLLNTGAGQLTSGSTLFLAKGTGTEASNAVTINQQSGQITSSSLSVAGSGTYVIALTNSEIATTSTVLLQWQGGTNTNANFTMSCVVTLHTATITIHNNSAATAISGTIFIGFAVV